MANTIEDFVREAPAITAGDANSFFSALTTLFDYGRQLPPWWSAARDAKIRTLWREDSLLIPSLLFAAQSKVANMPIQVVARDPNIRSHNSLAVELNEQFHALSEYGEGLLATMMKFSEDYFGQDNGGFIEIVAEGDKNTAIRGVPMGLRHLDAAFCTRRGDPLHPVMYIHPDGTKETFHHTRVIRMSQMPSSQRDMFGVGYSAISRSIETAKRYADMSMYIRGKMGGARAKKLLVGKNIGGREIIKAMAAATALKDVIGDLDTDTIAIGGPDIEVSAVDLHHYAEMNEEESTLAMMAVLAMAWGLELNEIYPIVTGRSNAEVSQRIGRSKMPATFIAQLKHNLSQKLVPPFLEVAVNFDDEAQEQQEAIIADIQARVLERMSSAGVMDNMSARRTLLDSGYMTETDFLDASLRDGLMSDGTPVQRAFWDNDYVGILKVPAVMLLGDADPEAVKRAVFENEAEIYSLYGKTTANALHIKYKTALAALAELRKQYGINYQLIIEEEVEEEDSPVNEEEDQEEEEREESGAPAAREDSSESIDGPETKALPQRFSSWMDKTEDEILSMLRSNPSQDEILDKMDTWMAAAWMIGAESEDIPEEDQEMIKRELALVAASAATIIARAASDTDMGPTAHRMMSQVKRIFNMAYATYAMGDDNYAWSLGPTEHCPTCLEQAAKGPRPGTYWKELALNEGVFPQSGLLACTGINCQCSYEAA